MDSHSGSHQKTVSCQRIPGRTNWEITWGSRIIVSPDKVNQLGGVSTSGPARSVPLLEIPSPQYCRGNNLLLSFRRYDLDQQPGPRNSDGAPDPSLLVGSRCISGTHSFSILHSSAVIEEENRRRYFLRCVRDRVRLSSRHHGRLLLPGTHSIQHIVFSWVERSRSKRARSTCE